MVCTKQNALEQISCPLCMYLMLVLCLACSLWLCFCPHILLVLKLLCSCPKITLSSSSFPSCWQSNLEASSSCLVNISLHFLPHPKFSSRKFFIKSLLLLVGSDGVNIVDERWRLRPYHYHLINTLWQKFLVCLLLFFNYAITHFHHVVLLPVLRLVERVHPQKKMQKHRCLSNSSSNNVFDLLLSYRLLQGKNFFVEGKLKTETHHRDLKKNKF